MSDPFRTVAITGAGSGIGAALARIYAARGCDLFLAGRSIERLRPVADECQAAGATVHVSALDVRNAPDVGAWIDTINESAPIDLLIVNAGMFGGRPAEDQFEPVWLADEIIRTNLIGAINCAGTMAPYMTAQRSGHIALISSLAAYAPSADAQAYSASKAGLTAYGQALREDLAAHDVGVTLVHPGHVETAQTRQQRGTLPLMIGAEEAARRISKALDARRSTVSFPRLALAWTRFSSLLPWRLRARLNNSMRFTVDNAGPDDAAAADKSAVK